MTHIRNGIPVTHRPDLSSMPQNEWPSVEGFCGHYAYWDYSSGHKKCIACKSAGIIAEMAELTSNSD